MHLNLRLESTQTGRDAGCIWCGGRFGTCLETALAGLVGVDRYGNACCFQDSLQFGRSGFEGASALARLNHHADITSHQSVVRALACHPDMPGPLLLTTVSKRGRACLVGLALARCKAHETKVLQTSSRCVGPGSAAPPCIKGVIERLPAHQRTRTILRQTPLPSEPLPPPSRRSFWRCPEED